MTTTNPGAKLKLAMNEFMGEVIDMGVLMTNDEVVIKQFRSQVLRKGNNLIREFNETLAENKVHMKITKEQLQDG